jgi:hypothetical protein
MSACPVCLKRFDPSNRQLKMTKEQALQQLREAREAYCDFERGVVAMSATKRDNMRDALLAIIHMRRKQAYNLWLAACQTFNQIVRGQ